MARRSRVIHRGASTGSDWRKPVAFDAHPERPCTGTDSGRFPRPWDAVRVAGDHLLGIADLKRPVNGDAGLTMVELKDETCAKKG